MAWTWIPENAAKHLWIKVQSSTQQRLLVLQLKFKTCVTNPKVSWLPVTRPNQAVGSERTKKVKQKWKRPSCGLQSEVKEPIAALVTSWCWIYWLYTVQCILYYTICIVYVLYNVHCGSRQSRTPNYTKPWFGGMAVWHGMVWNGAPCNKELVRSYQIIGYGMIWSGMVEYVTNIVTLLGC